MELRTNRDILLYKNKDAFDDLFNVLKTELNNGEYHIKLKSYYSEEDRKRFYDVINVIHDTLPRDYNNVIFISKRYHGRNYDKELSENITNYPADSSCCKYVDIFFDLICCCRFLCYSCGEGTEYVIKHPTYVMKPGYGCTSGDSGVQVRTCVEGDAGAHQHEPIQPILPN